MSKKDDTIISYLLDLGLSEEEIKVYQEILRGRGDTALSLSRLTGFKRTTVYRILDNIVSKGLIVTRVGERGGKFVASPIDNFDFLLEKKQAEINKLKNTLPKLQAELSMLAGSAGSSTQVLYYHGVDGLKHVTYNSLKARGELLTYELSTMNAFIDQDEAEKIRRRFVQNKIFIRTLTSATKLDPWTSVAEMVLHFWEIRHLDPGSSPFQFEILIYNDVYCMYRYVGDEIFCVEIHSQELADQQKALFNILWRGAKKFKILDNHGSAKLA